MKTGVFEKRKTLSLMAIFLATMNHCADAGESETAGNSICDPRLQLMDFNKSTLDESKDVGLGLVIGDSAIAKCDERTRKCTLPIKFNSPDGDKIVLVTFPGDGVVNICMSADRAMKVESTATPGGAAVNSPRCLGTFDYRQLTLLIPHYRRYGDLSGGYINHQVVVELFKKTVATQSKPKECFWPTSANGGNLYYDAGAIDIDAERSAIITEIMDSRENRVDGSALSLKENSN